MGTAYQVRKAGNPSGKKVDIALEVQQKKPYFQFRNITLYKQDCLEGIREHLRSKSINIIVTSPPYNIGIRYNSYDDAKPRENYLAWIEDLAKEAKRVLSDEGSFFLNVGSKPSDPWIPFDVAQRMRKYFGLQNVIHWVKSIAIAKKDSGKYPAILDDVAVGHYKPIMSKRFVNDSHEYIFHLTKTGNVEIDRLAIGIPYQDKSNIGRWSSGEDKRCRGNTWFIPYETIRERKQRPHPSTFPTKLPEMCIKLHGVKNTKLVLDPMMGIGSTAIACARLGLPCVGFEMDERYLEFAANRIRFLP